jgi:hypothetical protein
MAKPCVTLHLTTRIRADAMTLTCLLVLYKYSNEIIGEDDPTVVPGVVLRGTAHCSAPIAANLDHEVMRGSHYNYSYL